MSISRSLLAASLLATIGVGGASAASSLEVKVGGIDGKGMLAPHHAFCAPDGQSQAKQGDNVSPTVSWSKGPEGTRSYALILTDPDVPRAFGDANKAGRTIPADTARRDFHHWVLVDIPPDVTSLPEGAGARGPKTQKPGMTPYGLTGTNDFGGGGTHGGYDGPCPPWNDLRMHHYHFTVYALDVGNLGLEGAFGATDALQAMKGHVLASGTAVADYTLNAKAR